MFDEAPFSVDRPHTPPTPTMTTAAAIRPIFRDFFMETSDTSEKTRATRKKLPGIKMTADFMWILRTVNEGEPEQTFRILPGGIRTLGRAVGADFIVDAPLVSRVHCRLTALPSDELEVRDLDSTNGTFVNGSRVDSARLSSGDRIQVGRLELVALRDVD
ncbi:MAG: FHA domain-containing protein [Acidimicrobiia bacterium]|nr:FHA domain-containing protein [Acidimicrobiia bacterium]